VVANNYHSRRLNRPNDVVVKSDGSIYFTDPGLGRIESELDFCGVYRVSPDLGSIHVLVWDFVVPNGLDFSPDEQILYVNDSRRGHIRAFDVEPTGLLALATDRVFATFGSRGYTIRSRTTRRMFLSKYISPDTRARVAPRRTKCTVERHIEGNCSPSVSIKNS
jgi:sugar lactone lactonase YvrE